MLNFLRQEIKKKIDRRAERGRLAKINFRQQREIGGEWFLYKNDISKLLVKCHFGVSEDAPTPEYFKRNVLKLSDHPIWQFFIDQ